jgi:hypothetical protein
MGPVHVAGAMRALASSIDCLAGTVIGVIGLPTRIVRADWQRLWNSTKLAPNAQTRGRQQRVLEAIAALVTQAGPPGWLEWVLDTRNMLVHRGRRFHIFNVRGRAPGLIVTGNQAERIVAELVLPRDPQRTDADEWRAIGPVDSLLSESGSETLKGVFESTCKMVESIAQTLATVWQQRRDDSTFLLQPAEQWPEIVPTTQPVFVGYAAGSSPIDPRAITGDPEMGRRVMAAAVTDPARSVVWG